MMIKSRIKHTVSAVIKGGSQLVSKGAVKRIELVIVKIWTKLVNSSLSFWKKVTGKLYDF